ncbi:MAG TPA: sugar transferase, partial [Gemmatimonadaceae bacterium]|nr:sugar transferase [Gemmatimonadaceae bacterium]
EQARRHEVRPGLTGWAQVNGRNGLGWKDRFAYDVFYVDHCNFFLDTRIVLLTVARVLRRQGIAQDGQATMEPFRGNVD